MAQTFSADGDDDSFVNDSGVNDGGGDGGGGSSETTQSLHRDEFKSGSHMCSMAQSDISCAVPFACLPQFMHIQNIEDIFDFFSGSI